MSYNTSYTASTTSGSSTGVSVETSTGDETSSSSITAEVVIQTSSPDDSDGLAAVVEGSAVAIGENTLASGSLSGNLTDSGTVTSAELSATMVSASDSTDGGALAWSDSWAGVSSGAEVVFGYTVETQSSTQDATGSTASSTSTTSLSAYDIDLSDISGTSGTISSGTDTAASGATLMEDGQATSGSTSTETGTTGLDGNIAYFEFEALAAGEETLVVVDAFSLAIEDELSVSEGIIVLAVD